MPPAVTSSTDRRWAALIVVALAQLMIALDATIVTIALPSAQRDLGFSDGDRQWVVTAYTLTFAGLLLVGGRVADRLGRRRAFLGGLVGFAASSVLAGAASGMPQLLVGRALQGAFAALLAPTALSLIAVGFPVPRERARAFAVYGAIAGSGGAAGLLLGGALSQYADWRWCLWVNVVICVVAVVAGAVVLPPAGIGAAARIDLVSAALVTAGLAAVVLGCRDAADHAWSSAPVWGPVVAGVALVMLFLVRQARTPAPLLPLRVLADRSRAGAYAATAAAVVGSYGFFLLLTYALQVVRGWSPLTTGLAFLPLSASAAVTSFAVAGRLSHRVPARSLVVPGLVLAAAGLALLTRLSPGSSYAGLMLPAEVLLGCGMGLVFTPAITVATSGVSPADAGVAAAVANTAMQMGGSIGTAVLNTVAVTATVAAAGGRAAALVHGYTVAIGAGAALLLTAAVAAALLLRPGARRPPAPATSELERTLR